MTVKRSIITGLVTGAMLTVAAGSASAGHMPGGYYKHGGHAKHCRMPHRMYPRAGHPGCHTKSMHRGYAYGNWGNRGPYGKPVYGG